MGITFFGPDKFWDNIFWGWSVLGWYILALTNFGISSFGPDKFWDNMFWGCQVFGINPLMYQPSTNRVPTECQLASLSVWPIGPFYFPQTPTRETQLFNSKHIEYQPSTNKQIKDQGQSETPKCLSWGVTPFMSWAQTSTIMSSPVTDPGPVPSLAWSLMHCPKCQQGQNHTGLTRGTKRFLPSIINSEEYEAFGFLLIFLSFWAKTQPLLSSIFGGIWQCALSTLSILLLWWILAVEF